MKVTKATPVRTVPLYAPTLTKDEFLAKNVPECAKLKLTDVMMMTLKPLQKFISPWWDHGVAKVFFSCFLLFGWPMRLRYHGQIAKHQVGNGNKRAFLSRSAYGTC